MRIFIVERDFFVIFADGCNNLNIEKNYFLCYEIHVIDTLPWVENEARFS